MEKIVMDYLIKIGQEVRDSFCEGTIAEMEYEKIISPLEQLFFIEWSSNKTFNVIPSPFRIKPQYEIREDNKVLYRIDFVILKDDVPVVGIELDSFAYHDKTLKQFEYEKKRDRYLSQHNWKIFRFSGSEIMRDTSACVWEVISYLYSIQ